jgi:hypothetical protein
MRRYGLLIVVLFVGAAYVAGYWPEHQQRMTLERERQGLQVQLAEAQARVRLGGLLGQLLAVMDAAAARNYGQAQDLSSRFFEDLRAEAARVPDAPTRGVLEGILRARDSVTASLTRSDPAVLDQLRPAQDGLQSALGYRVTTPAPAPAPPAAAPSETPTPSAGTEPTGGSL